LIVSRATIRDPIAAWIGTSYCWRGDLLAQLLGERPPRVVRLGTVDEHRQDVDRLAREQDVELDQVWPR
jgi:hypothetical protein